MPLVLIVRTVDALVDIDQRLARRPQPRHAHIARETIVVGVDPMRVVAFALCLFVTVPAAAQRHQLATLTPAQAVAQATAASPKPVRAVFQFRVASAAKSRDGFYLDSEKNFRSPANLGVAIRASAMADLTKKFGADLGHAFVGKTVKLIGEVRRISVGKNRTAIATQVEVTHAGQILSVS
jgi:hypothetical protein